MFNKANNTAIKDLDKFKARVNQNSRETILGVTVDETTVKEINVDDNTTTYTMLVVNEALTTEKFQNLVVEVKPETTNTYLVEYEASSIKFNAEHQEYSFDGGLTSRIQIGGLGPNGLPLGMEGGSDGLGGSLSQSSGSSSSVLECVYTVLCNGTTTGGIGPVHIAGPNCTKTYTVRDCVWKNTTSGTGTGSSTGTGNTNFGGGSGSTSNTTNTPVVTSPVVPPPTITKPCEELLKLTSNTNLKNIYTGPNGLQNKVNEEKEFGFAFSKGANYDTTVPVPSSTNYPNEINMSAAIGGTIYGMAHTHPHHTYGFFPMFSIEDIKYLLQVSRAYNTGGKPRDYSIFTVTMTVPEGTFALKIKDVTAFYKALGNKYSDIEEEIKSKYEITGTSNSHELAKVLLETIKDNNIGIGIYQANANFSEWNELILPKYDSTGNATLEKKPCSTL